MGNLTETNLPRRSFLRGHFLNALKSEQVKQQGHNAIRPPWADFLDKCTACDRCVAVCETQILVRGAGGFPEVDFSRGRGECSFCQACVQACEADVFRSVSEPAWSHKIEILASCLVQHQVECRSCEDACPSRAIAFRRQIGGGALQFEIASCNGCGACLAVCPNQSIRITQPSKPPHENFR